MNDTVEGQGKAVVLPDGSRRIDFIRDNYYGADGTHGEDQMSRSDIKKAINTQLEKAGLEGQAIPYQIVFAATKNKGPDGNDLDPRIAAKVRQEAQAEAKAKRETEKAEAKAEKAKEQEAKKKAAVEKAAKVAKAAKAGKK